jgi:hypothetical protein
MKRISVDIGGTFTDCLVSWDGKYVQAKALTTHHNLSSGFNEALDHACSTLQLDRETLLSGVDSVRFLTLVGTDGPSEVQPSSWMEDWCRSPCGHHIAAGRRRAGCRR